MRAAESRAMWKLTTTTHPEAAKLPHRTSKNIVRMKVMAGINKHKINNAICITKDLKHDVLKLRLNTVVPIFYTTFFCLVTSILPKWKKVKKPAMISRSQSGFQ